MNLNELTIKEAQARLEKGEITSLALTQACLDRIEEVDSKVKACLTVCKEEAIKAAKEADDRRAKGETGVLLGIPFVAKDNIMTKGVRTTAASKILENYVAPYDATVIKKIKKAGAVLLAKVNLDEFAHGASTENSAYGPTHNPWDLERVAGGSSGGSAASVAADMCLFALGTDTGGSIRCPASFCGVVGFKPTYGRSSRFGLMAMTSSTDVPGPLTKTVEDSAIVLEIMAGLDRNDFTTVDEKIPEYKTQLNLDLKGRKIGIPEEFIKEADKEIREIFLETAKSLEEQGAELVPIRLPHAKFGIPVYYIITPSEISSNLARFDGMRFGFSSNEGKELIDIYKKSKGQGFGPETKRRIMLGTYALSAGYYDAYYKKAQAVRTIIKEELDKELENLDAIITPTQPDIAFKIGEQVDDPIKMYLEDLFVAPASLAGLPAVSVPMGLVNNMPVGIQIIGKRFAESDIFGLASQIEKSMDINKGKPAL